MAITRDKKHALVADMTSALKDSKLTVFAQYQGLTVADVQNLRKLARESDVSIKVIKNRLVRVAMNNNDHLKDIDTADLKGQLLYAYSSEDEIAPAKVLDGFAKTNPSLVLAGGFTIDGNSLDQAEVKALASLPSKNQLIAEVVAQLLSPVHDVTNALSGNLHGLLDGIEAKATA